MGHNFIMAFSRSVTLPDVDGCERVITSSSYVNCQAKSFIWYDKMQASYLSGLLQTTCEHSQTQSELVHSERIDYRNFGCNWAILAIQKLNMVTIRRGFQKCNWFMFKYVITSLLFLTAQPSQARYDLFED